MNIKLDENLPESLVKIFAQYGHEAMTVSGEGLAGYEDYILFEVVKKEGRLFVTLDLDFSDIRNYPLNTHHGIIVIRSKSNGRNTVTEIIRALLNQVDINNLNGGLIIANEKYIRIRKI